VADSFGWLLFIILSVLPGNNAPTIILVPEWASGTLPEGHFGCSLVSPEEYACINGNRFNLEDLAAKPPAFLNNRGDVVRVFVDEDLLSLADWLTVVNKIRSGWDARRKIVFLFIVGKNKLVPPLR
jgi:hypothetical protein